MTIELFNPIFVQFNVNGNQVKEVMPQLSVALATISLCWMVYEPVASNARVTVPDTTVTEGAALSRTSTVQVVDDTLPEASVAVSVMV